jgi:hypothetical protein
VSNNTRPAAGLEDFFLRRFLDRNLELLRYDLVVVGYDLKTLGYDL